MPTRGRAHSLPTRRGIAAGAYVRGTRGKSGNMTGCSMLLVEEGFIFGERTKKREGAAPGRAQQKRREGLLE